MIQLLLSYAFALSLDAYKWKNRVLVIRKDHPSFEQQKKDFHANSIENEKRDLILLEGSEYMPRPKTDFFMYLVGKDGDIKASYDGYASMRKVYKRIDAMPMRKEESKRQKK